MNAITTRLGMLGLVFCWGCAQPGEDLVDESATNPMDEELPAADDVDASVAETKRDAKVSSVDAPKGVDASAQHHDAAKGADAPPGMKLALVAVGWNGLRRTSYDNGLTWDTRVKNAVTNKAQPFDTIALVRAVTYGRGVFVAVGCNIWTSPDAKTWTQRPNPATNKIWLDGVAFGNDTFIAAGAYGHIVRSFDAGKTWTLDGSQIKINDSYTFTSTTFGGGRFAIANKLKQVLVSPKGGTWKPYEDPKLMTTQVAYCLDKFRSVEVCLPFAAGGFYFKTRGGYIERSSDRRIWQVVTQEMQPAWWNINTTFGYGYVPETFKP